MQIGDEIRDLLPEEGKRLFDDITMGRVLGAGRHIRMIGDMMLLVAGGDLAPDEKLRRCRAVGRYFQETRGKSSYAIVSAVNLMMRDFEIRGVGEDEGRAIANSIQKYFKDSDADTARLVAFFSDMVKNLHIRTIMVYDYSSTVEKCVVGTSEVMTVYVPESRAIDGGRPFVKPFLERGHTVRFIPDAAMMTVLGQVDAAFIGAETFYPDGSAFNTVGADILAELCRLTRVPYYVLTPLIKVDMRSLEGIYKEVIAADLCGRLASEWEREMRSKVDFNTVELVRIPPKLVTAYVTEVGVVPAHALFQVAREYNDKVNGK